MLYRRFSEDGAYNAWESMPLVVGVLITASIIIVGLGLGLGLGIGLNNGSGKENLTMITSTTTSTAATLVTTPLIISTFSNALTIQSSTYSPPHQPTPNHYYQLIDIIAAQSGDYIFQSTSGIDLYGYFYKNSFNVYNPSLNLITSDDNSAGKGQFLFTVSLQGGVEYFLVVTTYSANDIGSFTITASGPNYVSLIAISASTTTIRTTTTTKSTTQPSITSFIL